MIRKVSRFVLFTKGTAGDLAPFLSIGATLAQQGHKVTLISHCAYEANARSAGLTFRALDTPAKFEAFQKDLPLLNAPGTIPEFFCRHSLPSAEFESEVLKRETFPGTTFVIRHCSGPAELLDIGIRPPSPLVRVFVSASQVATLSSLEWLFVNRLSQPANTLRKKLGLSPIDDWSVWLRRGTLCLGMWPEWFFPQPYGLAMHITPSGFVQADIPSGELPPELETQFDAEAKPVLIVGSSGLFSMEVPFYHAAVEGARLAGLPALVICRHPSVTSALAKNTTCYRTLPLSKAIPKSLVIVHPGGMGTLGQAIVAGVPQLVMPHGADRPHNASLLEKLGVAKVLLRPHWQPERVAEALQFLVSSKALSRNCLEIAIRAAGENGAGTACNLIEGAANAN